MLTRIYQIFSSVTVFCLTACNLLADGSVSAQEEIVVVNHEVKVNKLHILYLLQSQEFDRALDSYKEYKMSLRRHDFDLLQQMALTILEMGARSSDPSRQLTSIFGSSIAGIAASIDILEAGIMSPQPETQMAAIQFLGHLQDDRCEELFTKAMSSDYFFTRMEAAHQLAMRKARSATGQIESLMHKVPPQMRFFFAQFFALIGTSDAMILLRQMMDDPFHMTRVEAILNAARFGRDDLLPAIRCKATQLNSAEQEACCFAIGSLKDSKSTPVLKTLSQSNSTNVQLAALSALYSLGDVTAKEKIETLAHNKDLFSIALLGEIPGSEKTLISLAEDNDLQVRFNATAALLRRKDPSVSKSLIEFLVRDSRDLGFQPQFSVGNSLMAWKVIPSAKQHQKTSYNDLFALSLSLRETLLQESLELSSVEFLKIAKALFDSRQTDLIPLLIRLMENVQTEEAIELLTEQAQSAGAPLTRAYCNLALLRLKKKEPYRTAVLQWISLKKQTEMIRFRPQLPWNVRFCDKNTAFELTPEENSRLLIECYQTLALSHEEHCIDILLEGMKTGNSNNRPILAGLLIQAIQ